DDVYIAPTRIHPLGDIAKKACRVRVFRVQTTRFCPIVVQSGHAAADAAHSQVTPEALEQINSHVGYSVPELVRSGRVCPGTVGLESQTYFVSTEKLRRVGGDLGKSNVGKNNVGKSGAQVILF